MRGHHVIFDRCELGLDIPDEGSARKRTAVRATRRALARHLVGFQCRGRHDHARLEGAIPGTGITRAAYADNCPHTIAEAIAGGIVSAACDGMRVARAVVDALALAAGPTP